jgi:hypothetical protein
LPMVLGNPFSKTNLYIDYTKKYASPTNNLHAEGFLTIGVSLNLYDNWFFKRKFE